MIPIIKVFSLIIRVLSRPIINHVKKIHTSQTEVDSSKLRRFFIWFGNFYHRTEGRINRKIMRVNSQFAFKPLNDELAIEKGIEFIYEVLFYTIVIGLPIYEMYLAAEEGKEKSRKNEERLNSIEEKISHLLKEVESLTEKQKRADNQKSTQTNKPIESETKQEQQSTFSIHAPKYCFDDLKLHLYSDHRGAHKLEYKMCLL